MKRPAPCEEEEEEEEFHLNTQDLSFSSIMNAKSILQEEDKLSPCSRSKLVVLDLEHESFPPPTLRTYSIPKSMGSTLTNACLPNRNIQLMGSPSIITDDFYSQNCRSEPTSPLRHRPTQSSEWLGFSLRPSTQFAHTRSASLGASPARQRPRLCSTLIASLPLDEEVPELPCAPEDPGATSSSSSSSTTPTLRSIQLLLHQEGSDEDCVESSSSGPVVSVNSYKHGSQSTDLSEVSTLAVAAVSCDPPTPNNVSSLSVESVGNPMELNLVSEIMDEELNDVPNVGEVPRENRHIDADGDFAMHVSATFDTNLDSTHCQQGSIAPSFMTTMPRFASNSNSVQISSVDMSVEVPEHHSPSMSHSSTNALNPWISWGALPDDIPLILRPDADPMDQKELDQEIESSTSDLYGDLELSTVLKSLDPLVATKNFSHSQNEEGDNEEGEDEVEQNAIEFMCGVPPLPNAFRHRGPLLPPIQGDKSHTLVLDLDETLLHCTTAPMSDAGLAFSVHFNGTRFEIYGKLRPGVRSFLRTVSRVYEVVVFTASQQVYAERVLKALDPSGTTISHVLHRDHCVQVHGNYLKDLGVLGRDLRRTLIIDNAPQAFAYHPANGLPIRSWYDDPEDRALPKLARRLLALAQLSDVRPAVRVLSRVHAKLEVHARLSGRVPVGLALAMTAQQTSSLNKREDVEAPPKDIHTPLVLVDNSSQLLYDELAGDMHHDMVTLCTDANSFPQLWPNEMDSSSRSSSPSDPDLSVISNSCTGSRRMAPKALQLTSLVTVENEQGCLAASYSEGNPSGCPTPATPNSPNLSCIMNTYPAPTTEAALPTPMIADFVVETNSAVHPRALAASE
jgi:Dullard-like phosphatase family protein